MHDGNGSQVEDSSYKDEDEGEERIEATTTAKDAEESLIRAP
jgi:hypothetical protein